MEDRSSPWDALEGDDCDERKPPMLKASSGRGDREMDDDRPYAMLLQENTDLKKEKKLLEAEKFQLVLDCDEVKVEFQQFVNNIHPLRDCQQGPDVGEPLMPYEIAAFKRDPVKFADLNPELREPLVRETKWRIEDAKLRGHALSFLQDKREDKNKGPEFEPEARKLAEKMIRASFEAHKDFVPTRDEPKPLPNTPVIASCTLPLESGETHFTITLTDDIRALERGFEEVRIEREMIVVVKEEDGQYNEVESADEGFEDKDAALFGRQEDPWRGQVQTGRFSYGAQTETGRGGSRGRVRERGRGPSRGGARRKNTKDIGFTLPDYISKSVEEHGRSTAPKRARYGTATTVDLARVTHSPIDAHFGDLQVRYREAGPKTRASTVYKSLQSTHQSELAQIKRKRRHLTSIQTSQGSASVGLMNQITSAQQSEESTSETMGNVKEEAAGNGK
ncbi:unnamed protein product, partial [Mesorhabditis belari]|uniref:Uncharacterized protein n=1 Tax=Mesorhabditis belari TaxID=2138241 RepID=A0AAF3FH18_9BILA